VDTKKRPSTKGLRTVAAMGVALLALLGFGISGTASAAHSSCGTYCWNVYAPFISDGSPYTVTGGGSFQLNEQSDDSNGVMTTTQESSASYSEQEILVAEPWIEGDQIHFFTPVGVTYTFTSVVFAGYSAGGWCVYGEWEGIVEITVVAGLVGTSYTVSNTVLDYPQVDFCTIDFSHHASDPGSTPVQKDGSGQGGWLVTQTLAIPDLPSGYYTPYVQVFAETYFEAIGAAGGSSALNMQTGGFYAQWDGVNINWGPGEG
jgi:hypothetical protein